MGEPGNEAIWCVALPITKSALEGKQDRSNECIIGKRYLIHVVALDKTTQFGYPSLPVLYRGQIA